MTPELQNKFSPVAFSGAALTTISGNALDAGTPLLLLPFRIETRFGTGAGGGELWIRVYPDQICIDSHEDELTKEEETDGKAYWQALWKANPQDLESLKGPWRALAGKYTPERAAWIALQLTPTNLKAGRPGSNAIPGQPSDPEPVFRNLLLRPSSWSKPAVARALPDFWNVVTIVDGQASTPIAGKPIRQPLQVGPDPTAGSFPPDLPVDEGLRWLVDFNTAVDAGMALRIPITPKQKARGFDRILVYGLSTASGDNAQPDPLTLLLNHHHYTDGISWLPQGSPTNNTIDASSAFSRSDPGFEKSYAAERCWPLTLQPGKDFVNNECDSVEAADWLGIDRSVFDHVQGSDLSSRANAGHMAVALWPATLGYFLTELMAGIFTEEQIDLLYHFFIGSVTGGSLPALRVGRTPYGILPVTPLGLWDGSRMNFPDFEPGLVDFLKRVLPIWRSSADKAPHVGGSKDPDSDLAGILGMDASSMTYRGRWVIGGEYFWNWLGWMRIPKEMAANLYKLGQDAARRNMEAIGHPDWKPRLLDNSLQPNGFPIRYPTIQDEPLSETDDVSLKGAKTNYISWLRSASIKDLESLNYPEPTPPNSLLFRILRQSLLLEYFNTAARAQLSGGIVTLEQVREAQMINIGQPTLTRWDILNRSIHDKKDAPDDQGTSWAEYLTSSEISGNWEFHRLTFLLDNLEALAGLPTAELDRLLTETLDICSHRLDAWATLLAVINLRWQRSGKSHSNPPKFQFGGYAWVENLKAEPARSNISKGEANAVQRLDTQRVTADGIGHPLPPAKEPWKDNGGFIFAPSMTQARTGAVLRSAYLSHKESSKGQLLAIDLNSLRVRRALWLLDSIRQGQSLGALLGYLFERGLHRVNADKYIQPFRDRYQLVDNQLTPGKPGEAVAPRGVVNGCALQSDWQKGKFSRFGNWGPGMPGWWSGDRATLIGVLKELDDAADALSDLSISEAVHQIIAGNPGRAGGILNAVSRGERPPEPDIVRTPCGGLDLTHRILTLFAEEGPPAAGWSTNWRHPRERLEPRVDHWAGSLLPPPDKVVCYVHYKVNQVDQAPLRVRLSDLDLTPLDFLSIAIDSEKPAAGELESRIFYNCLPPGASDARIDFNLDPVADAGGISIPDAVFAAGRLREFITGGRPLAPQDLIEPERDASKLAGSVDLDDLKLRAQTAYDALCSAMTDIITAASDDQRAAALRKASYFGVCGAVPASKDEKEGLLQDRADSVVHELALRKKSAEDIQVNAAGPQDWISFIQAVFAGTAVVFPLFSPPDIGNLRLAFAESSSFLGADGQAFDRWLQQLTHVREPAARLDMVISVAEIFHPSARPIFTIGQLPYRPNDRWLALEQTSEACGRGRVALEAWITGDCQTSGKYAGLLVDEWVERIPRSNETAGLAFHFNEPKARAPRCILIAVCCDKRQYWDHEAIVETLVETMDLARVRTVDLYSVNDGCQILPALYFPFNAENATISADIADILRIIRPSPMGPAGEILHA
jgi:hypothetical protein